MALMKCPECGKEISDRAVSCPNCGYPITDNSHLFFDDSTSGCLQEDKVDNDNHDDSIVTDTGRKTKLAIRIISSIACGLLFVFLLFTFGSQLIPCEHEWNTATCEHPATCVICGETTGEVVEHQWKDATCFVPKTCAVCQMTEGHKLSHSFTAKVATYTYLCNAATKDSPATYYYSCSKCQTKGRETFTSGQRLLDRWEHGYYVDNQFGEQIDRWYVTTHEPLEGTFENSATDGADLLAEILYDCYDEITIFLYEYGDKDNLVKNSSSSYKDYYKIVVKNEDGGTYEARGQMWPGEDRIYVVDIYHSKVLEMMQTSETIRFFIQSEESPTSQYRFDVDMNNFNAIVHYMK